MSWPWPACSWSCNSWWPTSQRFAAATRPATRFPRTAASSSSGRAGACEHQREHRGVCAAVTVFDALIGVAAMGQRPFHCMAGLPPGAHGLLLRQHQTGAIHCLRPQLVDLVGAVRLRRQCARLMAQPPDACSARPRRNMYLHDAPTASRSCCTHLRTAAHCEPRTSQTET